MEVEVERVTLRLRAPLRAAWGTVEQRELLRVRVRDEQGRAGIGEAGAMPGFDEVTEEQARAAALDVARWDLRGKRAGRPVASLLADSPLAAVPVNALVDDHREAAAALAAGFRCVKVKVGLGDDPARVAAVRAAVGPEVAIRLDANGAWSVEEAVRALAALAHAGIELCEEPVHGVEELQAVRAAVAVPVAMDETASRPGAVASGAADAVCLRIGAQGGISGLLEAAAAARAAGSDVYLASTLDGPAGVAGAVHAAAALGVKRPCGLATLGRFAELDDPLPPREGCIAVPSAPGLGI